MAAGKIPKEPRLTKLVAWGKAHPERMKEVERRANAEKREARRLEPPEAHAARFEALAEHDRESWRRTRQAATRAGDRWTIDEDAALIAHGLHLYQVAFELGRTLYAERVRLNRLRAAAKQAGCTIEELVEARRQPTHAMREPCPNNTRPSSRRQRDDSTALARPFRVAPHIAWSRGDAHPLDNERLIALTEMAPLRGHTRRLQGGRLWSFGRLGQQR